MALTPLEQILGTALLSLIVGSIGVWLGGHDKMTKTECERFRLDCQTKCEECKNHFCKELTKTQRDLDALMSYARYDLQSKGLNLQEINTILKTEI